MTCCTWWLGFLKIFTSTVLDGDSSGEVVPKVTLSLSEATGKDSLVPFDLTVDTKPPGCGASRGCLV